jgi:hypothetical protein
MHMHTYLYMHAHVRACAHTHTHTQAHVHTNTGWFCTTPMETLRSTSKCNTVPDKQHDLLNNKAAKNTIMKLHTHKIYPSTECWLHVQPKDIDLSLNHIWMDQQHTSVTHGASKDPLALTEYTPKQNFATSPKLNFSNVNSLVNQNRVKFSGLG